MAKQTELPGVEDTTKDPDIERALDTWLQDQERARQVAKDVALSHSVLLMHITAKGRETYPYIDPKTGKRKQLRPKATVKVVSEKLQRKPRDDDDQEHTRRNGKPADASDEDTRVESRRVSRASVEAEIDPFGATRGAMADNAVELGQAGTNVDPPAKPSGKKARK